MKKTLSAIVSILFLGGMFFYFQMADSKEQQRKSYENYLSEEYQKVSKAYSEKVESPEMAALQNYYMTMNPVSKEVPSDGLRKAWEESQKMISSPKDEMTWTTIPSNMGGRTRALMWDPNDSNGKRAFIGNVTSGLWKIEDGTSSSSEWEHIEVSLPAFGVSSLTYDPNNTQIFYAGTGESQTARVIYRESGSVGIGILKSTDGGESWELLPATVDFKYVSDVEVKNEDGVSVLYAGVLSGMYHGEQQSTPSEGLYRSADGGATWTQVLPNYAGTDKPFAPADIEIAANGRIFVGTAKNEDGNGGASILYSDTGLAGSWTVFDDYEGIILNDTQNPVPGRVVLAAAPSDPNRVYALIGAGYISSSTGFNYAYGRNILKSSDNGVSWSETQMPAAGGNGFASLSWHAFEVCVSPTDPDDVYVGGLDIWGSGNGGNSWSQLSDWVLMYYGGGPDYVHGDIHNLQFNPTNDQQMLIVTDGGVFYCGYANANDMDFVQRNKQYNSLLFYTCDIHPGQGQSSCLGGLQDNGTLFYTGNALDINDMITGGDGAYCFFDENSPGVAITSVYYNSYYTFSGNNFYDQNSFDNGVFINPADYDSENDILYANACKFSGSLSNKVLRIKNIPSLSNYSLVNMGTDLSVYYSSLKVSPYSPANKTTLYLGSQTGRLFRADNAQSSPNTVEIGSTDFPIAYISSIAIGGSEDTLLVTFSNYGVPSVWQTYDGGDNWTDISEGLPDMPIRWALYHPETSKNIMLATELGIWRSNNGYEWFQDQNFPNVRVDMLQMRAGDNSVLAASHGRGLIYGTWDPVFVGVDESLGQKPFTVFPNPVQNTLHIQGDIKNAKVKVFTLSGQEVFSSIAEEILDLSSLPSGDYLVEITAKEQRSTYKISKIN